MAIRALLRATGLGGPIRSAIQYMSPEARSRRLVSKSMSLFKKRYDSYWHDIVPDRAATKMVDAFDAVSRDGFVMIPDYLSTSRLEEVRKEVLNLPGLRDGKYVGDLPFINRQNDGICAFGVTDAVPATHAATVGNEELHSLARALFGKTARLSASSILSKYDKDRVDSSEAPHWDDWRVRLKMFIYLTDVDETSAPTLFVKGSVSNVPWRLEKDFASVYFPKGSAGGSWWPVDELGLEKVICTGKAGSMLVFDTRGLHAGTRLTGSPRIMLMNMYTTHMPFTHRVF